MKITRAVLPSKKFKLPNGLTLIVAPNKVAPTVSLAVFCDTGLLCERENQAGLANLVALVLDEGSRKRGGEAIQEELEGVGGQMECGPTGASMALPSEEFERGVRILAEILSAPSFPEKAFRRKKVWVLSEIQSEMDDPQAKARSQFRELVYGKHPLHRPSHGYQKTVSRLQRRDLVAYHKKFYGPEKTIVSVAGDVDLSKVERVVRKHLGKWNQRAERSPAPPSLPAIRKPRVKILPERHEQVHIYLGHGGVRRSDPDFYRLQVMDHVLGTGPGFTDRLSKKLRDDMGLAYTVHAAISSSAGREPGTFSAYMGTSPAQFELAVKGILREIRAITRKAPSKDELRLAKDYLTGSYLFGIERNMSRAMFLINRERYGLGDDYLERYPQIIESVTPQDVLEAARRHIHPDHYVLSTVGPVKRYSA